MRSSHKNWLFNGAVVLGITSLMLLGLFALADQFLKGGLGSLAESIRDLEQAGRRDQCLKEEMRRIREKERLIDQLINDLIDQRCGLRAGVARWRAAHLDFNIRFIDRLYPQGASEEERIILHLTYLVNRQLKQQPSACAEVLARLRLEKAP